MLPFCHVRSSAFFAVPRLPGTMFNLEEIQGINAFIFFLNKKTLNDHGCVNLLARAIELEIPVLYIRSPVFQVKDSLPIFISSITIDPRISGKPYGQEDPIGKQSFVRDPGNAYTTIYES